MASMPVMGQVDDSELINSYWLTDRIFIVGCGEMNMDMIAAVNTEKGIVIIDSGNSPSLTAKYKAIIEKEFGRSDFKYLINTHSHGDHIRGNQVFKDAEIIAHKNTLKNLKKEENVNEEEIKAYVKQTRVQIEQRNLIKKTLDKDSGLYKQLRARTYIDRNKCDDYESVFQLTLPTITFTDNLTLDMGNMEIELFYFGSGFHTEGDIIISIPAENIVFTGDILEKADHQYSYGVNSESDFDPWISSLDKILQNNNDIENIVTMHYGILPGVLLSDFHNTLKNMRDDQQQKTSAVDSLSAMIASSNVQEAVNKFEHQFPKNRQMEYFVWAGDLNSLAREYQGKEKYDEAQIILKMWEKRFPNSTAVLYSQVSIFMEVGKTESALKSLKKLLRMNPSSCWAAEKIYQLENDN
ncbi:MBL fold metallo-hydrolase [bacterium]|nr:MBL fold metallo-hydrolase [bacterium]